MTSLSERTALYFMRQAAGKPASEALEDTKRELAKRRQTVLTPATDGRVVIEDVVLRPGGPQVR